MTKEQEEAIEICKKKIIEPFYDFPNPTSIELKDTDVEAIETVLNMLKEKDKEIENKDEIIDLMAYDLADYVMYYEYDKCRNPVMIKNKAEQLKEYYERKARDGRD